MGRAQAEEVRSPTLKKNTTETKMRGKPYIKIMYPEASEAAMLLTEAMIRRSSGKRIVETTSEERESSGDLLFADACGHSTDTSVELQLNLAPEAMDYALATLIGRNLTEEEKRAVRMATGSTEVVDLLSPRAEAGASTCTEAVGTLREPTEDQEEKIEIGKMEAVDLRRIITDLQDDMVNRRGDHIEIAHRAFDAICEAAHMTKHDFAVETDDETHEDTVLDTLVGVLLHYVASIKSNSAHAKAARKILFDLMDDRDESAQMTWGAIREAYKKAAADGYARSPEDPTAMIKRVHREVFHEPLAADDSEEAEAMRHELTWDDVMAEARKIGQRGASEPTDDGVEDDGEIDAGLLDDIEDRCAPAGEVIGHDE